MKKIVAGIRKELDYHKFLTPINFDEENEKFLRLYNINNKYNPQYLYNRFLPDKSIALIHELKKMSSTINDKLKKVLIEEYIEALGLEIEMYAKIGTQDFSKLSTNIFGIPNSRYKNVVNEILKRNLVKTDIRKTFSAQDIANLLQERLIEYGFEWAIDIKENMSTKVSVDPDLKQIVINAKKYFSSNDIKRLIVHEIDTHVLRSENGERRNFFLFSSGTANSMIHEEGLAIYNELINNVLDDETVKMYAARFYCCLNIDKSFYELFDDLIKMNFSQEMAMYVVARIKRGICDTSKAGGFIKDYIYMQGLFEVKSAIDVDATIYKKMYFGSISLNDIQVIEQDIQTALYKNQIIFPINNIQ